MKISARGMKLRVTVTSLCVLALSLSAWAEERSYELRGCGITEMTAFDKAGDTVVTYGVTRGVTESVPPGGPFDKMTYECRSVAHSSKDGVEFTNRCVFVDADGHRALGTSNGTSKGWQWKFLAGTGKWEGISGGGPSTPDTAYPRLSPAIGGGCWRGKGTYELKK